MAKPIPKDQPPVCRKQPDETSIPDNFHQPTLAAAWVASLIIGSGIQPVFLLQIPVGYPEKCALAPKTQGVRDKLRFCKFCEKVNNFSGKCLPTWGNDARSYWRLGMAVWFGCQTGDMPNF